MTDNDIKTICEKIDSLHEKILKSKFAETVTESEILSLIFAVQELQRQQAEIERLRGEVKEKTEAVDFLKEESVGLLNMFCEAKKEMKKLHPYKLHCGNLRMEIAREVIDRLKEYLTKPEFPWDDYYVTESVINHLLKEMEEENEQNY